MSPHFKAFIAMLAVMAIVVMLFSGGCASVPVKADAPVVAAFIMVNRCDGSFEEAAFVRSDGTIVETTDLAEAKQLAPPAKDNGRIVPVYDGECAKSL